MKHEKFEKQKAEVAKQRLVMARSLPDNCLLLADRPLMSTTVGTMVIVRDSNTSLQDKRLAILILETVRPGDWTAVDPPLGRILAKSDRSFSGGSYEE